MGDKQLGSSLHSPYLSLPVPTAMGNAQSLSVGLESGPAGAWSFCPGSTRALCDAGAVPQ